MVCLCLVPNVIWYSHHGPSLFSTKCHMVQPPWSVFKHPSAKLLASAVRCGPWWLLPKPVWQTLETSAGKMSPDYNHKTSLHEIHSMEVFLQCQEIVPSRTIRPKGTELIRCHVNIALMFVDVTGFCASRKLWVPLVPHTRKQKFCAQTASRSRHGKHQFAVFPTSKP